MKIKVKKLDPRAVINTYAQEGDAAIDMTAIAMYRSDNYFEYGTGLSVEIPEGYVGLLFPRSSITNMGLILGNSVGVIDSGYRGEIKFRFYIGYNPTGVKNAELYHIGDKIGQMIIMPYPQIELEEVEELTETDRGTGGYGSTGV